MIGLQFPTCGICINGIDYGIEPCMKIYDGSETFNPQTVPRKDARGMIFSYNFEAELITRPHGFSLLNLLRYSVSNF
jgi:hypothetical protein